MDYLTVISTRSVILFVCPKSTDQRSVPPDSSRTTPKTVIVSPSPIGMPINSLMNNESDCAHFLLHQIFTSTFSLGSVGKEISAEAELIVWKEIDRATLFIRKLGQWFATSSSGKIGEKELKRLTGKFGLELEEAQADYHHAVTSVNEGVFTEDVSAKTVVMA